MTKLTIGLLTFILSFNTYGQLNLLSESQKDQIRQACNSELPVLVYDNFPSLDTPAAESIDLNGDKVSDIYHGEFVEKLVQLSGHSVVRLNIKGKFTLPKVKETLENIISDVENGNAKFSRINFSQEIPLEFKAVQSLLEGVNQNFPELSTENLFEHRKTILRSLWTVWPEYQIQEIYSLFTKLKQLGLVTISAAGNGGPEYFNLYSLMPGVISVGSLDLSGNKRVTSSDHSLVQVWKKGVFVSQSVKGGLDINGDDVVDFQAPEAFLSETSPVALLSGKKISDHLQTISQKNKDLVEEFADSKYAHKNLTLNVIKPGLYEVSELLKLPLISDKMRDLLNSSGTYVLKEGKGTTFLPTFFEDNGQGELIFDPLGSGETNQKALISGTSFAAPTICKKQH